MGTPITPISPISQPDDYWEDHGLFQVHKKHSDPSYVGDCRMPLTASGNPPINDGSSAADLLFAIYFVAVEIFTQQLTDKTSSVKDLFNEDCLSYFAFNKGSQSAPILDTNACSIALDQIINAITQFNGTGSSEISSPIAPPSSTSVPIATIQVVQTTSKIPATASTPEVPATAALRVTNQNGVTTQHTGLYKWTSLIQMIESILKTL